MPHFTRTIVSYLDHLRHNGHTKAAPAEPTQSSIRRRVWNLAWPVIGENFLETMLGVVDTILVGSLGAAALAGVGTAVQVMVFLIATLAALSVGASVLIAQSVGAENYEQANELARQSLLWSVIVGIPVAAAGLLGAEQIIAIFGLEPEVAAIAVAYVQVTMGTMMAMSMLFISRGVLRGAGDSQTPFRASAVANLVNVALTYGLIFGRFGLPEMGAVGSAWGTLFSRLLALAILLVVMWRGSKGISIRGGTSWLPHLGTVKDVLRIGIPAALEQVLVTGGFLTMALFVADLGTSVLAAHRVLFNILSLSYLPGIGFGIAALTLVGQSIGARHPTDGYAANRIATIWALMWMSSAGFLIWLYSAPIVGIYTQDQEVIREGVRGLRIMALIQPFWAILFVQANSLRGTGNTGFPMRVIASTVWGAVLIGAGLVRYLDGDLMMAWSVFLVTSPPAAYLLWQRFWHRPTIENAIAVAE